MSSFMDRRTFVQQSVAASAAALTLAAAPVAAAEPVATAAKPVGDGLPKGKIKDLEISRILLGGNLLTHFTHSRDLRYVYNLAKHYNTQEKIFETLATAEANGINTLVIHTAPDVMKMLVEYREKRGGKIQWIICSTAPIEDAAKYDQSIQQMVDAGVDAVYIWGVQGDALVAGGKVDVLARAVEMAKSHDVPCGVGGHELAVIEACEKNKIPADFYIKTLHHHDYPTAKLNHDSSWCSNPEQTIQFMHGVEKPWIAFKVMAAGAIPPENAFQYVFNGGADFSLAGMFDFEIAEDVAIAKRVLAGVTKRSRPWRG